MSKKYSESRLIEDFGILTAARAILVFARITRESSQIHRLFLATKGHKGTQRKKQYPNLPNEKFLGVQKGLAAPTD